MIKTLLSDVPPGSVCGPKAGGGSTLLSTLAAPVGNLPVKRGTRVLFVAAVVRVFCQPGHGVTLPCFYPYEDRSALPQLSVQWRGPDNQLLCHYIKHKGFQRCSEGYHMTYRPGSITLTVQQVRLRDYGPHVCSVSKRDEFSDSSVELARAPGESDGRGMGAGLASASRDRTVCLFRSVPSSHLGPKQQAESVRWVHFIALSC